MNTYWNVGSALASALVLAGTLYAQPAQAHGGGLNAQGCHTNKKTGDYHCHRNTRATQPMQRAQSINGRTYYASCAAARADGKRNIRRGQAGYRRGLDRDNDGIACES